MEWFLICCVDVGDGGLDGFDYYVYGEGGGMDYLGVVQCDGDMVGLEQQIVVVDVLYYGKGCLLYVVVVGVGYVVG